MLRKGWNTAKGCGTSGRADNIGLPFEVLYGGHYFVSLYELPDIFIFDHGLCWKFKWKFKSK